VQTRMQRLKDAGRSKGRLRERACAIAVAILCVMILFGLNVHLPPVSAQPLPEILLSPSVANISINETFTMTVNLTDFSYQLFSYQVVFKYNQTVLNMTGVTFPANNVFAGQTVVVLPTPTGVDSVDGLAFVMPGQSLEGLTAVTVTNNLLFTVNFTAIGTGDATITACTIDNPAHTLMGSITEDEYTIVMDSNLNEYTEFTPTYTTVISGVANAAPIAFFTISSAQPTGGSKELLLYGNAPIGASHYLECWIGLPVYFNASGSIAPTGNITEYVWNFGDGNTTVVHATGAPSDSLMTHVYAGVGPFYINLTVVSMGTAGSHSIASLPFTYAVVVGLALPYFDWTPFLYTVAGLVVAVIVISIARSVVQRVRRREKLKSQKPFTPAIQGQIEAIT